MKESELSTALREWSGKPVAGAAVEELRDPAPEASVRSRRGPAPWLRPDKDGGRWFESPAALFGLARPPRAPPVLPVPKPEQACPKRTPAPRPQRPRSDQAPPPRCRMLPGGPSRSHGRGWLVRI